MFSRRSTPTTRRLIERAADVAVAFATLESITSVRELLGRGVVTAPVPHPHRREPLHPKPRPGRPGVVVARPHACATTPTKRTRTRAALRASR